MAHPYCRILCCRFRKSLGKHSILPGSIVIYMQITPFVYMSNKIVYEYTIVYTVLLSKQFVGQAACRGLELTFALRRTCFDNCKVTSKCKFLI